MRSDRNAKLNFGLASIPVGVSPGVRREDVSFKLLHRTCSHPMRQMYHCDVCEVVVPKEDQIRGIEMSKNGPWLPVEASEIQATKSGFSEGIEIRKFIPRDQLSDIYYGVGRWLIPPTKHPHIDDYWSFLFALVEQEAIGLGRANLYSEQIVAIVPIIDGLQMFDLHAPSEIVEPDWEARGPDPTKQKMAGMLIAAMHGTPEDEDFIRESNERKKALIEGKLADAPVHLSEVRELPEPGNFMDQLRASIDAAQKQKRKAKK